MSHLTTDYIKQNAHEAVERKQSILCAERRLQDILKVAQTRVQSLTAGNKPLFPGNGGSAGDSQRLVEEIVGCYKLNRSDLPAITETARFQERHAMIGRIIGGYEETKFPGHQSWSDYGGIQ